MESAVSYAVARGAGRIILSGWSMGGTIALLTAERSAHRDRIVGVVLVGPVTSWRKAITAGAVRLECRRLVPALSCACCRLPCSRGCWVGGTDRFRCT